MAATTIIRVMGVAEPCGEREAWYPIADEANGGMMEDFMEPLDWHCCSERFDNDDTELNIGWMDPQLLMQGQGVDTRSDYSEDLSSSSSLPSPAEAQWIDTSSFMNEVDSRAIVVVPDDFINSCGQPAGQAGGNIELDWFEDPDVVDSFLQQLESQRDDGSAYDAVANTKSLLAAQTVNCSQLELLLRRDDTAAAVNTLSCSEVDTDVDIEELQNDTDSDGASDDSDWSYSGRKRRRKSTGRKRAYTKHSQLTNVSATSVVIRKKEQNKNAATRYRDRKRVEEQDNETECLALEKRNKELRSRVSEMTHEVTVLRKLIVDIFRDNPVN